MVSSPEAVSGSGLDDHSAAIDNHNPNPSIGGNLCNLKEPDEPALPAGTSVRKEEDQATNNPEMAREDVKQLARQWDEVDRRAKRQRRLLDSLASSTSSQPWDEEDLRARIQARRGSLSSRTNSRTRREFPHEKFSPHCSFTSNADREPEVTVEGADREPEVTVDDFLVGELEVTAEDFDVGDDGIVNRPTIEEARSEDDGLSLVQAFLVSESPCIPQSSKGKVFCFGGALAMLLVPVLASLLAAALSSGDAELESVSAPNELPSGGTLAEVKSRGVLRCGFYKDYIGFSTIDKEKGTAVGFNVDLCRAVAAVVLGDPNKFEPVIATGRTRFPMLRDGKVDLLAMTTTHNMGRDVFEGNSLSGFTFSAPYVYTGLTFAGVPVFVDCAERLDWLSAHCREIVICIRKGTTYDVHLQKIFPGPVKIYTDSHTESYFHLENAECNVVVDGSVAVSENNARVFGYTGPYKVGKKLFSKEMFCMNTRDNDNQWSNLVNLMMNSLYSAERQGINQDNVLMENSESPLANLDDHMRSVIVDTVKAVGNYQEVFDRHLAGKVIEREGLNEIYSSGNNGLIYSHPFGNLETEGHVVEGGALEAILARGFVRCGVTKKTGFAEQWEDTWSGFDIEFCRALAAALFSGGNSIYRVQVVEIEDASKRFETLAKGDIDVLAGERVTLQKSWKEESTGEAFTFSAPYFYSNSNPNDAFAFATRQGGLGDSQWSDMVYWVVTCLFYAEEQGISKENFMEMPLVFLFGEGLKQLFVDAVQEVGNYGDMYSRTLQESIPRGGGNMLSTGSHQQFAIPLV